MIIGGIRLAKDIYEETKDSMDFQIKAKLEHKQIGLKKELCLVIFNAGNKTIEDISIAINRSDYKLYSSDVKKISYIGPNNEELVKIGKVFCNNDIYKHEIDITIKYENKEKNEVLKIS